MMLGIAVSKPLGLSEGLVPRIHGNTGRTAHNALVLEEVKGIITFVMQYVESNGILLPGRIPGYKRDDINPLAAQNELYGCSTRIVLAHSVSAQ